MKLKRLVLVLGLGLVLAGCGDGGEKVIGGEVQNSVSNEAQSEEGNAGNGESKEGESASTEQKTEAKGGYVFNYKGYDITIDGSFNEGLSEKLGEPLSYYEAASCAFEGLDKVYTYSNVSIKTYPQKDKDLVSNIGLMDDSVATKEGVCIGDSKEDVIKAYGDQFTMKGNMMVYGKDGMNLGFIVENDAVAFIEYSTTVLDEE